MKLTKIELNEGIKLSEVISSAIIYRFNVEGYYYTVGRKKDIVFNEYPYYIIRDNKVIDIIQDENTYQNELLIVVYNNKIGGYVYYDAINNMYKMDSPHLITDNRNELKGILKDLNKKGFEVYKQE